MEGRHSLVEDYQVPIINLADMGTEPIPDRGVVKRVGTKLVRALSEKGLAFIVNHGVPDYKISHMYNMYFKFCRLPNETRVKYNVTAPGKHGYMGPIADQYTTEDTCHQYIISGNDTPFPDEEMPEFQTAVDWFAKDYKQVANVLLTSLAAGLDQPWDFFTSKHKNILDSGNESNLCFTHYHHTSIPETGKMRHGPKTDDGTITLITQNYQCGIEIQRSYGNHWDRVGFLPRTILVKSGDRLAEWTNQQIPALKYRDVIAERLVSRLGIQLIVKPDDDVVITPVDTKITIPTQEPVVCRLQKKKRGVLGAYYSLQRRLREAYAS